MRRVAYIPSVKKDQVECRSIHIVRGIGVATERSVAKVGARSARVREAHDIASPKKGKKRRWQCIQLLYT